VGPVGPEVQLRQRSAAAGGRRAESDLRLDDWTTPHALTNVCR
jgi:hypothetical protein